MSSLLRDVRYSLKLLVREGAFSLTVLLTLGVCIGANVAIYSVVHTVLLTPLPFDEADELVTLYNVYPGAGAGRASNSVPDFFERRERVEGLEEVAAYQSSGVAVGGEEGAEMVSALRVTPSFFPVLRVQPRLGRAFLEAEMVDGAEPTVLLTHGYWQEALGGDPGVVGTSLRLNGTATTVVGVLPDDFRIASVPDARMVLPLSFSEEDRALTNWHSNSLQMLGRLAPGGTVERVRDQVAALNAALMDESPVPGIEQLLADARFETVIVDTRADLVRDVRSVILLLWGGAGFVLLIGCVNIANLMMARAQTRTRELATRLSLGARRARVARQVLTEAGVMALLGGIVGLGLGVVGVSLLTRYGIQELPRGAEVGLSAGVIGYTLAVALGAAMVFGAIPVVHLFRSDLGSVFREEGRGGTSSRSAVLFRNGLVTAQIALAFVLLVGAGLMLRSFQTALRVDPGFEPEGVLSAYVSLPGARYPEPVDRRDFARELVAEARALPGVSAAGITTQLPFGNTSSSSVIFPEGYAIPAGESIISPRSSVVGPGYFEAIGLELRRGRDLAETDGPDSQGVVVIDEWLAERFWPEGNALGQRMVVGAAPGTEEAGREENLFTVVGVVESSRFSDLTRPDSEYRGAYYLAHAQRPASYFSVVLKSAADPGALVQPFRAALADLDVELPAFGVMTMRDRISESLISRRTAMTILLVFAGVALALAVVGVYGVLAYAVARRTREIGIRMAVGSEPGAVFALVLREGMTLTAVGLALGVLGVVALTRLLDSLLFAVQAADPAVLAVTAVVLAGAAALACAIPARRATRVDPNRALAAG